MSSGGGREPSPPQVGSNNNKVDDSRSRWRGNRRKQQQQQQQRKPEFMGSEPEMNGNIYDVTPKSGTSKFVQTTRELKIFVGRKFTSYTTELVQAIDELKLDDPKEPEEPGDAATPMEIKKWERADKKYEMRKEAYDNFRAGLYSTVYGQCTEALKAKLEARRDFDNAKQDGLALLRLIRSVTHTFEQRSNLSYEAAMLRDKYQSIRQGKYETLSEYRRRLETLVDAMDEVNVSVVEGCVLEDIARENGRSFAEATVSDRQAAKQRAVAMHFLLHASQGYEDYRNELRNSMLNGRDEYPTLLADAFEIMERRGATTIEDPRGGVAFAHAATGSEKSGNDGSSRHNDPPTNKHAHIRCFRCNQMGHFANMCRDESQQQETPKQQQQGAIMAQAGLDIPKTWVLLDNQSTVHLFGNADLLDNIYTSAGTMTIKCN